MVMVERMAVVFISRMVSPLMAGRQMRIARGRTMRQKISQRDMPKARPASTSPKGTASMAPRRILPV